MIETIKTVLWNSIVIFTFMIILFALVKLFIQMFIIEQIKKRKQAKQLEKTFGELDETFKKIAKDIQEKMNERAKEEKEKSKEEPKEKTKNKKNIKEDE